MEPIRHGLFEISQDGYCYLLTNKCERCGISYFPRREKCINCLNNDKLRNTTLSGSGKLYTYTTIYRATPHFKVPFMVGYVDFEQEGIRVFAQLTECRPEDLEIGMDMELVYEEMDMAEKDKRKLVYKFKPLNLKK
jgi:uncharacterized OB-fold protein